MIDRTFAEVAADQAGTVYLDETENGVRFLIVRGPSSLCAYAGVPVDHPLAGHPYQDIPVQCHGGLTYSGTGDDWLPDGWFFYGWDYSHSGDRAFYHATLPGRSMAGRAWTPKDVKWSATYDFWQLAELASKIASKVAS